MKYEFTVEDLELVESQIGFGWVDFPILAYRFWHKLPYNVQPATSEIEDFIIDFMSQYNSKVRANTF